MYYISKLNIIKKLIYSNKINKLKKLINYNKINILTKLLLASLYMIPWVHFQKPELTDGSLIFGIVQKNLNWWQF